MNASLLLVFSPAVVLVGVSAGSTYLSFRARRRGVRCGAAAVSVVSFLVLAWAVALLTIVDDFNDFPGYTCVVRDGYVPAGFPADRLSSTDPDVASLLHPDISFEHEREWLPVGVRCSYSVGEAQEPLVVTHSSWAFTVLFYSALALAGGQGVRLVRDAVRGRGVNRAGAV